MTGLDSESKKASIKTREELIEECLEIGIPVTGYEDEETLEMFLGSADDDDYADEDEDDNEDDEFEDENEIEEPSDEDEIFDEDFDFDEDEDEDLFEDDEASYN